MSDDVNRIEKATQILVELKDTSELMMDLAYSSILLNNSYLAEEVQILMEKMSQLHFDFDYIILSCKIEKDDVGGLIGLLRIGTASEKIADAASEIAQIVLRGIEPHPVLSMVIQEAEETVERVTVPEGSPIVNKTLKESQIPEETGMWVLAIRRGDRWIRPKANTVIEARDIIVAAGYADGETDFKQLICGCENPLD
ncbi:hypothetical protein JW865_07880 [Candidatus Bathyarchaeota archaeon]|nr:hypothetical protein [Candidatus Bathyarchaeota archaeon]